MKQLREFQVKPDDLIQLFKGESILLRELPVKPDDLIQLFKDETILPLSISRLLVYLIPSGIHPNTSVSFVL
ncbi:UNVERIFIED_CONTAM: hypothetical protein Sindi_0139500 [Sesamum indicum]